MKPERFYNTAIFLLATCIAASAQYAHTVGTHEQSYVSSFASASTISSASGDDSDARPAYSYETNKRWASSTMSVKALSNKIGDVRARRSLLRDKQTTRQHTLQRYETPFFVQPVAHRISQKANMLSLAWNLETAVKMLAIHSVYEDAVGERFFVHPNLVLQFCEDLMLRLSEKYIGGRGVLSASSAKSEARLPPPTIIPDSPHTQPLEGYSLFRIIVKSAE